MTEEINTESEPDEAVTAEPEITETESETSQSEDDQNTETPELILDVEDAQQTSSNQKFDTSLPEYKAFSKVLNDKRKKQQLINEMVEREKAREAELNELKSVVAKLSVGEKPTIESCDYDYSRLEKELDNWYRNQANAPKADQKKTNTSKVAANTQQPQQINEVLEYEHFRNEQKLKKVFNDYDQETDRFKDEFHQTVQEVFSPEINRDRAISALLETGHKAGVDMSKAMFAIAKVPALKNQLFNPGTLTNDIAVADILRQAEKSIKSPKNSVKSKPPADIKQGGAIDHTSKKVQQLLDKWGETGEASDYKAYREAKKLASKN